MNYTRALASRTPADKHCSWCLSKHPRMYRSRWDVYQSWFLVNGNSYQWLDGRLVYSGGKEVEQLDELFDCLARGPLKPLYPKTKYANIWLADIAVDGYKDSAIDFAQSTVAWEHKLESAYSNHVFSRMPAFNEEQMEKQVEHFIKKYMEWLPILKEVAEWPSEN